MQRLLAGESQKTLRQFGAALRGIVDHRGDCRELGLVGDGVRQDLDGPGDDGENVVEVVGDAAGQLADGLHLLRLRQLLLLFDQLLGALLDAALELQRVGLDLGLGGHQFGLALLQAAIGPNDILETSRSEGRGSAPFPN